MPIDYKTLPDNWLTAIRPGILARAKDRCEECGAANHALIVRSMKRPALFLVFDGDCYRFQGELLRLSEIPGEFDIERETRVVLTIHHIDEDRGHNDPANLIALCQRCHFLKHPQHTRRRKIPAGQLSLF